MSAAAIISRVPLARITRRNLMSITCIGVSCAVTAMMSFAFNHYIRGDMMVTGFLCAIVCDLLVRRVTRHYRRRLADAYATLEQRVRERTAELETANRALMVADRMATAGTLAAGVCHEIRSPLQVICMASEELSEAGDELSAVDRKERVTDICDAAARIATLASDLRSLARPIDDPLGPVRLDGAVRAATRLASYQFDKDVVLEHGALDVPAVRGNESRIVQVVLNLVVNAARAKREGAVNRIHVTAAARGERVELAVSDTGTGMSEDTRARLFQPFFTTGSARGGTGLGLTICRTLVERMGGAIEVDSTVGQGTTMRVLLPAA